MGVRRLIRDRALFHIVRGSWQTCPVCGKRGHLYSANQYGEATDHCFWCHSHRRKRALMEEVLSRCMGWDKVAEIAPGGQFSAALRRKVWYYTPLPYPKYRAESLPFPDASFDIVVACDVIEHFSYPAMAMREIVRVLKPGGRFLSAVLVETEITETGGLYGYHLDENGGPCPVYTRIGEDICKVACEWANAGVIVSMNDGVLRVKKWKEVDYGYVADSRLAAPVP
jgi:SAM-dependent methyltransferase